MKLFKKTFKFTGGEIVGEFLMSIGYLPGAHDADKLFFDKDSTTLLLLSKGFGAPTDVQLSMIRRKIRYLRDFYFRTGSLPVGFEYFTLRVGRRNFAIPRYFRGFLSEHDNKLYSGLVSKYIDSVSLPDDFRRLSVQYDKLYSRLYRSRAR